MILHLDADAFFASCEQAMHPEWKGRPVITGAERGIVSAASYEAKARGVDRGTPLWEVKNICPDAIIVPSDYESYSLFSARMFDIMRRFTGEVEEYSIDEAFADLTGQERPLGMSVEELARAIKDTVGAELGFTVSVGVAETKTLAKIGSKWNKPNGCTVITTATRAEFLSALPVEKVWGIGKRTGAVCRALGLGTARAFADAPAGLIRDHFAKPYQETWHELNGRAMFPLDLAGKTSYDTISKTKTFTPPSADRAFVRAQLLKNVENAAIKARRHRLLARGAVLFLKRQDFSHDSVEISFPRSTAYPLEMSAAVDAAFMRLFRPRTEYRATGAILLGLESSVGIQTNLFEAPAQFDKLRRLYAAVDDLADRMGKHTVRLGADCHPGPASGRVRLAGGEGRDLANSHDRGANRDTLTFRKQNRLPGETARLHLNVPLLDGHV
jgi:DNA polymerase-4/DNA polymerase V